MEEFMKEGGYDSLVKILTRIERKVDNTQKSYREKVTSLEAKVLGIERRLEDLESSYSTTDDTHD